MARTKTMYKLVSHRIAITQCIQLKTWFQILPVMFLGEGRQSTKVFRRLNSEAEGGLEGNGKHNGHGTSCTFFSPLPSLELVLLLDGVILGAGRHGWVMHRGGVPHGGPSDVSPSRVCSKPGTALPELLCKVPSSFLSHSGLESRIRDFALTAMNGSVG